VRGTLASEWGKTWSVRAPAGCLAGAIALVLVTATSLANDFVHSVDTGQVPPGAALPAVDAVVPALQLGQLAFAAFALQLVTAEYATGAIGATLRAQPRRHLVVLAKAVVAASCGAVAGGALGALAMWSSAAVLGARLDPAGPGTADLAVRAAGMLALVAVLVVGLAAAIRSAVGTLAAAAALLVGTLALPGDVGRWAPGQASAVLLDGRDGPYPPLVGLIVLAAWAAAVLGVGLRVVQRRDS
jgi:ABC-2 type transport system permease protein